MAELTDTQREALESACLEGLVWTEHGYRYRPNVGADAVERLLPVVVREHVTAALDEIEKRINGDAITVGDTLRIIRDYRQEQDR
ncbi:hypothetical protein F9L07_28485 [Pimelobacter simplex]|uniref:Uncharacterized protein n=1 Tax=Nocardioides simplex TaxID=2045 RepID=A0A7J5DQM6_NOCSI|nr:hypothetical protein [Pimelobacter simplex]KAB2806973.1 hypothetical protein F9L07_28485 [Pimelobacter simplex]